MLAEIHRYLAIPTYRDAEDAARRNDYENGMSTGIVRVISRNRHVIS